MREVVYCPYVESYVTVDGFTCPKPHCPHSTKPGCPLKRPTSTHEMADVKAKPPCFGDPFNPAENWGCDICPYVVECCNAALRRTRK